MCSLALLMGSVCYSHGTIGKANGNRGGGKGNFTWLFFFFSEMVLDAPASFPQEEPPKTSMP